MHRLSTEIPTWAGAAGPRTPAMTQSRWRTNGKTMRKDQVETVYGLSGLGGAIPRQQIEERIDV